MLKNIWLTLWIVLVSQTKKDHLYKLIGHSFKSGVLNLLVLVYPQIKNKSSSFPQIRAVSFSSTPQNKNSTQISFFWVGFNILGTPCELLTYPRLRTAGLDELEGN